MGTHQVHSPGPRLQKLALGLASRPCLFLGSISAVAILLMVSALLIYGPIDNGGKGGIGRWTSLTDPNRVTDKYDTMVQLVEQEGQFSVDISERTESNALRGFFYYRSASNVFSRENLLAIQAFEEEITGMEGYGEFCLLKGSTCDPAAMASIINVVRDAGGVVRNGEALKASLKAMGLPANTKKTALFQNSIDLDLTADVPFASTTRSLISYGLPYKKRDGKYPVSRSFRNADDRLVDQQKIFYTWLQGVDFFDPSGTTLPDSDITVYHQITAFSSQEVFAMVLTDLMLVVSAAGLVGVVLFISTASSFVAFATLFQILLSYPVAFFIYRVVLQQEVMTALNQLTIFITLAIGADNCLVTHSFFQQTEIMMVGAPMADIVGVTILRSFGAISVTNLTTWVAFAATALSSIPATSAFGVMASNMILANFGLSQILLPCILVIWTQHIRFKDRLCKVPGFGWVRSEPLEGSAPDKTAAMDPTGAGTAAPAVVVNSEMGSSVPDEHGCTIYETIDQRRLPDRVFFRTVVPFFQKFRFPLIAIMGAISIVGLVFMLNLSSPDSFEPTLPDGSAMYESVKMSRDFVPAAAAPIRDVYFVYPDTVFINRDGVDRNRMTGAGVIDIPQGEASSIKSVAAQEALVKACEATKSNTDSVVRGQADCPMLALKEWLAAGKVPGVTFPTDPAGLGGHMKAFLAAEGKVNEKRVLFNDLGHISLIADRYNTTMPLQMETKESMDEFFATWEELLSTANDITRDSGLVAWQGSELWVSLATINALVGAAVSSILISLSLAFVVVLGSTRNIYTSLLTILTIICIVVTVMGIFQVVLGWQFDLILSIVSSIVAGLSIDYCLHLIVSYDENTLGSRFGRVRASYAELGGSVTNGFLTTALATCTLLLAKFEFFRRMGTGVALSVFVAFMYSMFMLAPLLLTMGPLGESGKLSGLGRKKSSSPVSPVASTKAQDPQIKVVGCRDEEEMDPVEELPISVA